MKSCTNHTVDSDYHAIMMYDPHQEKVFELQEKIFKAEIELIQANIMKEYWQKMCKYLETRM